MTEENTEVTQTVKEVTNPEVDVQEQTTQPPQVCKFSEAEKGWFFLFPNDLKTLYIKYGDKEYIEIWTGIRDCTPVEMQDGYSDFDVIIPRVVKLHC